MTGRLPISLLSALAWGQLAKAAVPADPTITAPAALLARQNNDRFIGWVETSGTWSSQQCDVGLTWYQDGNYAQCCPTTLAHCYAPTACVDGSMIYPYSEFSTTSTIACTDNYGNSAFSLCNTAFIFENFEDSQPRTDIVCGDSQVNWSYYRKIPASATEEPSTTTEASSTSANEASTGGSTGSKTTLPSLLPQQEEKKESSSKAWIAGAVVGPIVGLAIIGAIIFFLVRRKNKNKNNAAQPPHGVAAVGGQPPVTQYTEAKPQFQPEGQYVQPSPGYNPQDPYNQYGQQPLSPAPQYGAPYSPPGSPPPQGHYAPDQKQTFQHMQPEQPQPQAAELGGASSPTSGSHTAELSGEQIQRQT